MFSFLWRVLDFIGDVVVMHLLWLLSSLPVFTIGASTTALYYTAMKRIRTDEGTVISNFKSAFRKNFRQATVYWLLLVAAGAALWLDLNFAFTYQSLLAKATCVPCFALLFVYWLVLLYIFPVQAKFEATLFGNFKNALLLSVRHFHMTLLLTAIWASLWLLAALFPPFTGLLLICGAGFIACLTSPVYIQVFRKYVPEEVGDDLERTGGGITGPLR